MPPIDPFDTPPEAAFPSMHVDEIAAQATANVQSRLAEDVHARAKRLEIELATMRAELENVTRDRDDLQKIYDGYCQHEPPIVKGALDAQEEAEKKYGAASEQAQALSRDLAHLRGLHEHTTAQLLTASTNLCHATAVLDEIATEINMRGSDISQIRRAVSLLQTRSVMLDHVLDGILDGMSSQVRALISGDELGSLDPRNPLALHLHVAGAAEYNNGWQWTAIGEALRLRRVERLGGRQRSGEYEVT